MNPQTSLLLAPRYLALLTWLAAPLAAQCADWLAGLPLPGLDTAKHASLATPWDPDGSGPLPERLVVANSYQVRSYDPTTRRWEQLPSPWIFGARNPYRDFLQGLAATPQGSLFVALPAAVVRFDGSQWVAMNGTTNGRIDHLGVHPSGDLLVGGKFTQIGGVSASGIVRRQGGQWAVLGGTASLRFPGTWDGVHAVDVLPSGDLVASGAFEVWSQSGRTRCVAARLAGSRWTPMDRGTPADPFASMNRLAVLRDGTLVGSGALNLGAGRQYQVAYWSAASGWLPLGAQIGGELHDLKVDPTGELIACGSFRAATGSPGDYVTRWDGSAWRPLGAGLDRLAAAMTRYPSAGGELVVVGRFERAGRHRASGIASWRRGGNPTWSLLGDGLNGTVLTAEPDESVGGFLVGGEFTWGAGQELDHVATFDGSAFRPLGGGLDAPVRAVIRLDHGDIVAGGDFTSAGGQPAAHIARFDGSRWTALGTGLDDVVHALAVLPNGDLVAGGEFTSAGGVVARGLARWDGARWSAFDASVDGVAKDLLIAASGDLVVAGTFASIGGASGVGVARWNGSSWTSLGLSWADCVAELPGGDLVAGRDYSGGGMYRWSAGRWVGYRFSGVAPAIKSLAVLPDGDVVSAGRGIFGVDGNGSIFSLARWSDTQRPRGLGTGIRGSSGGVHGLGVSPAGVLAVGGDFETAGGVPSAFFARHASTCAASATVRGAACPSSGGANRFRPLGRPWIGAEFRARATGLPSQALTAVLTGLGTTQTPLASLLPATLRSPPSCQLLVTPDLSQTGVPVNGVLEVGLPIPDDAALVGALLHQQVLAFDLGNPSSPPEVTSTQALALTLGDF